MRHAVAKERLRVRTVVVFVANTLLVLAILDFILWGWYALYDAALDPFSNNIERAYGIKLGAYYPGFTQSQIDELINETYQYLDYEPFVEFRERPRAGKYVNVDPAGFRWSSEQSKWPPDPSEPAIFVFGGSTTFGYGVPDSDTVVSALAAALRRDPRYRGAQLYNFGRGFYWSTQEHILFSTMLLGAVKPSLAVFIDGINEFYYSGQRPVYADGVARAFKRESELTRTLRGSLSVIWQDAKQLASSLPMFRLADAEPRRHPQSRFLPYDAARVHAAIANYFANKAMIESAAAVNGVETVFAWQPIPSYHYPSQLHAEFEAVGYGPHSQSFYGYPQMRAAIEQRKDGNPVWCADVFKDATAPLYDDLVHYNRRGAELLAECIAAAVLARETLDHLKAPLR
jgi:hypothetical protein